jgi:hypothetical protein
MIANTMDCNAAFPVYVRLDEGTVIQLESAERILYHLEAIDIENDEYLFWDANSCGLKILVTKNLVGGFEKAANKITLQQAFEGYADQLAQLGVRVDTTGTPEEIYARLQKARESLPRPPGFFSWLFRRTTK